MTPGIAVPLGIHGLAVRVIDEAVFTDNSADISGWVLLAGESERHVFPSETIVNSQGAIVIFGGGTPTGSFSYAAVQTASTGSLELNNEGDVIQLRDDASVILSAYAYGAEGGNNHSLTRFPDISGAEPLVAHTEAAGSEAALFSPGSMTDGTPFPGSNTPPDTSGIEDVTVDEDAPDTSIDLRQSFSDNEDVSLMYTVTTNSNPGLFASVTVSSNLLILDYADDVNGSADIIVTATNSDELSMEASFTVTVNPVNDPPVFTAEDPPVTPKGENPEEQIISQWVTDLSTGPPDESEQTVIACNISGISNPGLFVVPPELDSDMTLTYTVAPDASGTSVFIVTMQDDGGIENNGSDTSRPKVFTITVISPDNPPTIANPIADIEVNEEAEDTLVDLTSVFSDIDNDDDAIVKSVSGNSNPDLVSPSIDGNILTLAYHPDMSGTADITITGLSGEKSADDTFTVVVTGVNDAPFVSHISEQSTDDEVMLGPIYFTVGDAARSNISVITGDPAIILLKFEWQFWCFRSSLFSFISFR